VGLMSLFGGGSGPEKAVKLKSKVTQKYGDPLTRQKAISQLGEMKIPEAVAALLARFTITVEPATTDADEKENVFELIKGFKQDAVPPVKDFLRKSDLATSWAVRLLEALVPGDEVIGIVCEMLQTLANGYSRDPSKKVMLLTYLEDKDDPRVAPAALPLLEDMADDVKIAALKTLTPHKYEPAREPILKLLTQPETGRRVQVAALASLADAGFGVQGYREKVEALVGETYLIDKSGILKRR
jgi:HEAT repeat protein